MQMYTLNTKFAVIVVRGVSAAGSMPAFSGSRWREGKKIQGIPKVPCKEAHRSARQLPSLWNLRELDAVIEIASCQLDL